MVSVNGAEDPIIWGAPGKSRRWPVHLRNHQRHLQKSKLTETRGKPVGVEKVSCCGAATGLTGVWACREARAPACASARKDSPRRASPLGWPDQPGDEPQHQRQQWAVHGLFYCHQPPEGSYWWRRHVYLWVRVLFSSGVRHAGEAGQSHVGHQTIVEDQEGQPLPIRWPPVGHVGVKDLLCWQRQKKED